MIKSNFNKTAVFVNFKNRDSSVVARLTDNRLYSCNSSNDTIPSS